MANTVREYTIVKSNIMSFHPHEDLVKEVMKLINEGWQPLGGVAQTNAGLAQAMVR